MEFTMEVNQTVAKHVNKDYQHIMEFVAMRNVIDDNALNVTILKRAIPIRH